MPRQAAAIKSHAPPTPGRRLAGRYPTSQTAPSNPLLGRESLPSRGLAGSSGSRWAQGQERSACSKGNSFPSLWTSDPLWMCTGLGDSCCSLQRSPAPLLTGTVSCSLPTPGLASGEAWTSPLAAIVGQNRVGASLYQSAPIGIKSASKMEHV